MISDQWWRQGPRVLRLKPISEYCPAMTGDSEDPTYRNCLSESVEHSRFERPSSSAHRRTSNGGALDSSFLEIGPSELNFSTSYTARPGSPGHYLAN